MELRAERPRRGRPAVTPTGPQPAASDEHRDDDDRHRRRPRNGATQPRAGVPPARELPPREHSPASSASVPAIQPRQTTTETSSGPRNVRAVNSPCQASNAEPSSSEVDDDALADEREQWVSSATSDRRRGRPTIPLRLSAERERDARVDEQRQQTDQPARRDQQQQRGPRRARRPPRSTIGWAPATSSPAARLAAATSDAEQPGDRQRGDDLAGERARAASASE